MRKQTKLISLILVLALLLSALAIFAGATDTEQNVNPVSDELTPSATVAEDVQNPNANSVVTAGATEVHDESFKSANMVYQQGGTGTVHYTVTETESGNKYGTIVATQESTTANQYANVNGASIELDHNGYLVIELDIATETEWITGLSLNTITRPETIPTGKEAWETDLNANAGIVSNFDGKYADGNWHHITMIVDIKSASETVAPVSYLFVDGEFLFQQNAAAGRYDPNATYTFSEVRLNIGASQTMKVGQSVSYDNFSARVVSGESYDNAVANKSLAGTELSVAPAAEKLSAIVEINGVKHSNIKGVFGGMLPLDVTVLRDFYTSVPVTCDATVETNGYHVAMYAGDGVTATENGTVITYDAPFVQSLSTSEATTDNNALYTASVDKTMPGNLVSGTYNKINDGSLHIVTDNANGGEAVRFKPGAQENYLQFSTGEHIYTIAENRYVVFEFDVLSEVVFSEPRNTTFSLTTCFWIDGAARYGSANMVDALKNAPAGKYVHVTVVFQAWKSNGGSGLAFADGVGSGWGGSTYNANSALNIGDEVRIAGMRLQTSYDVTIDNVSLRIVDDTTGQLGTGFSNLSLAGWEDAVNAPKSTYPPIALVNGEYVEYASELNSLLASSREPLDVTILRDDATPLVVGCDATVDTNGCAVTVTAGTDTTVVSTEGNVTVYDAPFKPSFAMGAQLTSTNAVLSAVRYPAADNILRIGVFNSFVGATGQPSAYLATNAVDGNDFLYMETEGATSGANSFIDYTYGNLINYDANNSQYIVYDFDFAFAGEVATESYGMSHIVRIRQSNGTTNVSQCGGTSVSLIKLVTDYDVFHHITVVFDLHENKVYYFVDGSLYTEIGTVMNTEAHNIFTGASNPNSYTIYFDCIRLAQNLVNDGAIDNMYLRYLTGDNAGNLSDALSSGLITAWDKTVYNGTNINYPPIATVDGKGYSSLSKLNSALSLVGEFDVEILREFEGTVIVNSDATVNTNGLNVSVVAGAGVEAVSTEGNVTVYDALFTESKSTVVTAVPADILAATKYSAPDNLYSAYSSNNMNNGEGTMQSSVVTNKYTGDVYLTVEGGADNSNSYITITPSNAGDVYNDPNSNTYMAVDFDVARYGELTSLRFQPIFRHYHDTLYSDGNDPMGGNSWTGGKFEAALNAENAGEFQHVTVVYDFDNNLSYWFVNGAHVCTVENGVYAEAAKDFYKETYDTANGERFVFESIRFAQNGTDDFSLDNLYIRTLKADVAEEVITKLSVTGTAADVTANNYKASAVAPLASINGVYYGSLNAINNALATESEADVSILATFDGVLNIKGDADINTNGLSFEYTTETGLTELGEGVLASAPMVIIASEDGTTYKFVKLTAANAANYCSATYWYLSVDDSIEEIIYFPYGTQIEYVGTQILHPVFEYDNYIENGQLFFCEWTDENGNPLETLPVASEDIKTAYYMVNITSTPVDIGITGAKFNLTLHESFGVNLYVPAALLGADENTVTVDGTEYVKYSESLLPSEIDRTVEFLVEYEIDGESYCELISTTVLEYAEKLIADEGESNEMKALVLAALNYANEACRLLADNEYVALTEFLTANAQYLPTDSTEYAAADVSALKGIIKGVQLSLESEVAYVINVCDTYEGEITVSYETLGGETVTKTFAHGETVKVNVKALDLAGGITITVADMSVDYSLAAYAYGIEAQGTVADFAKALNLYANAAKAYAEAVNG